MTTITNIIRSISNCINCFKEAMRIWYITRYGDEMETFFGPASFRAELKCAFNRRWQKHDMEVLELMRNIGTEVGSEVWKEVHSF